MLLQANRGVAQWFRNRKGIGLGKIYDTIFWMKWPPPWWTWVLAAVVIVIAGGMFFVR